jgi:phospholipase C
MIGVDYDRRWWRHVILLPLCRVDTMHRVPVEADTVVQNQRSRHFSAPRLCTGALALALASCAGGGSPPPSYTLTVTTGLGTVTAGKAANLMLWVTPQNGYTGTVSLSCAVKGGGTPPPTCVLSAPSIAVSGVAVFSNLTVSSALSTPGGSYSVAVSAHDANLLAPSNGPLALPLVMSAVIQHIVIIFQENRTPDNLFQDPVLIARGADIASSGVNSLGQTSPLVPIDLGTTGSNPQNYDLSHAHAAFVAMYDGGKMDGADRIPCSPAANCPPNAHANAQFMYVTPADVQPYFALAEQYTFGDRMFQTNEGPSFPAHQFIIAGTSAPTASSPLFAAENPALNPAGCIASAANTVAMIDAGGSESAQPPQYPCFDHPTLTDLLGAQKVSWRYYAPSAGSIWTGPDAIQHICSPQTVNGTLTCTGALWTANVVIPQTQVLTDILNGQLAQVSWVIPDGKSSDHAVANDGSGPSWVASIVNAIGNSAYWANTAIIITWDDWGGWYDHVAPTVVNDGVSWGSGYVYGFRVPLIVVSPYAKTAYISHVNHDFGSILKLIESTFNLTSLGYADVQADDLSDCFNLTQAPTPFHTIVAPLGGTFFIHDHRPPVAPDDD